MRGFAMLKTGSAPIERGNSFTSRIRKGSDGPPPPPPPAPCAPAPCGPARSSKLLLDLAAPHSAGGFFAASRSNWAKSLLARSASFISSSRKLKGMLADTCQAQIERQLMKPRCSS
eukprot:TRINITY_DN32843_c0_g1_i1.p1 TRINITY_DN32843_c0_g1~~TRINITY_DN32843_c0_g1_i1.p1  ORF type:complete len:116 (-),score=11.71 TRINITY_DN32843_c0_g1_i1:6-353(-)